VEGPNPYFPSGTRLKGHEFHYSRMHPEPGPEANLVFRVTRGAGICGHRDGFVYKNVLATYTHLHALGAPDWAPALIRQAREHQGRRQAARSGEITPADPAAVPPERTRRGATG
jgi:cobyrinic acid a,c-diamide synthase